MKTIQLVIELTYEDFMHGPEPEEVAWFYQKVLGNEDKEGLYLHSNYIGDTVGEVKVVEVL